MKTEFEKLKDLENLKKITIGIHRKHANNFLYHQTTIGKILNWLTPIFCILTIFIFIRFTFFKGALATISTGIYVVGVQKIAGMYIRILLLQNEQLFDVAYQEKSITIRNNSTNEIIFYPTDWKKEIAKI